MLSRLKAWWTTPMVSKAGFDAMKQEALRHEEEAERLNIKVRYLNERINFLEDENRLLERHLGESNEYASGLEDEIAVMDHLMDCGDEDDEYDSGICGSCGNDIEYCCCFYGDEDDDDHL